MGNICLPVEYKCHTFAGTVGAVEVIERANTTTARMRYYTPDWDVFPDPMNTFFPEAEPTPPPRGLADMLAMASRLGTALETYMRSTSLQPIAAACPMSSRRLPTKAHFHGLQR